MGGRPLGGGDGVAPAAVAARLQAPEPGGDWHTTVLPTFTPLAAEVPLPTGARAQFLLKRRSRLCVTEPEAVDAAGRVEWMTHCTQVRLERWRCSWAGLDAAERVQVATVA